MSKKAKSMFIVMGIGIAICVISLGFAIKDAVEQESSSCINIVALTISSVAAILSFVLSGVATYLSERSSKKTDDTLEKMNATFTEYIDFIKSNGLSINQENMNNIIESYQTNPDGESTTYTTPISK